MENTQNTNQGTTGNSGMPPANSNNSGVINGGETQAADPQTAPQNQAINTSAPQTSSDLNKNEQQTVQNNVMAPQPRQNQNVQTTQSAQTTQLNQPIQSASTAQPTQTTQPQPSQTAPNQQQQQIAPQQPIAAAATVQAQNTTTQPLQQAKTASGQANSQQPNRKLAPGRGGKGPSPKKVIFGCLGFLLFSLILFIFFVLAYVSQTSSTGQNAMAKALGVNAAEFTNTLILMTDLIFGLIVIIAFFVTVFGFFKAFTTPKNDKPARSKGIKQGVISAVTLIVILFFWVIINMYLNGKKVEIKATETSQIGIFTEPSSTTKLTAPIDVKFDATKIPYDENNFEITFYQWDFGDGDASTSPIITHTYRDVGQYEVQLVVTARNLNTDETASESFNKLVTVIDVKADANFTFSPESGPAPLTVEFDATDSESPGANIVAYDWDFNGRNNFRDAEGSIVSHTFDREGAYEIKLRITDSTGKTSVSSKTLTIGGPDLPIANIDIPTKDGNYYVDTQLTFLAEKSTSPNGNIVKYEWDFGDGTAKATTRTASHKYKEDGLYEVILRVTDEEGKTGTASEKITLEKEEEPPQAVINTTPKMDTDTKIVMGQAPFEVTFSGNDSTDPDNNIVEYQWDFDGDGKTDGAGLTTTYVYKKAGSYNATLTVLDAANNESTMTVMVKVSAQQLTARIVADQIEGNAPLTVTFDASGSSYPDGDIASYEWDFGDGSAKIVAGSKVSYKYTAIGNFTASVVAKASDGSSDKAELIINVRPIALQACFTADSEEGPAPLTIEFDPRCSQGAVLKYLWDFGDGTTSRTRKPTHTFDKPSAYQVTLEVSDNQNVVSNFAKNILITGEIDQ